MIHIEVASHFNEDAFSYGLALGLADRLRAELADVRCDTHGGELTVRLSTQGIAETLNDITVEVSGCCDDVTDRVRRVVEEVRGRRE
jgi:hypothetical protein